MLRKYKSRNNKHNLNFSYLTDFTIFHYLLQLLLNDPYVDGQLKSLDEFKKVLTKVDQNLSRDKITLSQE